MSANSFGKLFRITSWGESHGEGIGVVIDGCPSGLALKASDIQKELERRRVGQSKITSPRQEKDTIHILSGVFKGKTTGTPISLLVYNHDIDSSKYEKISNLFRPGHADYTYFVKYGFRDFRGGGRASARETIARVAAGAIAKLILDQIGLKIVGYTKQVGQIEAQEIDLTEIEKNPVRCPDKEAAKKMEKIILEIAQKGDSIGGLIEVIAQGVPPGLGEPVFDKLDAQIAMGMMSIGGVKGVEIGCGFKVINMLGSENNDEFINLDGNIATKSNNAGGILGGISNGGDIVVRLAVKPPSSIFKSQTTVNEKGKRKNIQVEGRHDPCICPRIVPVAEAMLAMILVDNYLLSKTNQLKDII